MSRIGNQPITLPQGVSIEKQENTIVVTGPKGKLVVPMHSSITFSQEENIANLKRKNDEKEAKALHGLTRSLLNNAVIGVTEGYQKRLELVGTGYRVKKEGEKLILNVGFSHEVTIDPVVGVDIQVEGNNAIVLSGIDKQLVGQFTANIRRVRPPEPYKGKGIRYKDEVVRRKSGKAAKTAA
jgi:large subunit ribosomal protein L6